ncbi:MAG: DNA/RNA non-specific endonuclease [Collinsella aerofaciens]
MPFAPTARTRWARHHSRSTNTSELPKGCFGSSPSSIAGRTARHSPAWVPNLGQGKRGDISRIHPPGGTNATTLFRSEPLQPLPYRWSLCGENANRKNLLTGTRYLNETGMLPFEEQILNYIRDTGNHVLYRVTPMYNEEDLVCRGVRLEAQSVEDHGKTLCFHVYCYNLQQHVQIDYATGRNRPRGLGPTKPQNPKK